MEEERERVMSGTGGVTAELAVQRNGNKTAKVPRPCKTR